MEYYFVCTECGNSHNEPGDARLGHRVICLDCVIGQPDAALVIVELAADAPIAA
jgi:hypothetical protein